MVVDLDPSIDILLQRFQTVIDFSTKRRSVKLILNRLMKAFTYSIGLRRLNLGPGMLDVFKIKI